jgi:dimethylglycine dehydrogenase
MASLKTDVRALVVGGGAVGTGIAYHLQKAGWDTMLLERDELTAGSTWHAAGLLPLFNMSFATTHIHNYSVEFYKSLEQETGLDPGFFVVGNLRMAQTQARMDEYMVYSTTAETCGVHHEFLSPKEIADRWPLVRTEDLVGALFHPQDGYINPADVTQAMAKGARSRGLTIERKWQVDGYEWAGDHWRVTVTRMEDRGGNLLPTEDREVIRAEHVVTATGNHAQRTARMLGLRIPAIPVEHQYIVTEQDPALVQWRSANPQHPVLRDADAKWYVREERGGWILGPYEQGAPSRFSYGVPAGFRADLFPLDLERIEGEYMSFIHRIPSSETVGLKDDYNGPICYTPDGNPLVGPRAGACEYVAGRGLLLRHHRRGRHGALPRADDDGRGGRDRHGLARPQALRQLDDHRIRGAEERGVLLPRLHPPPPRRGARGGAALADLARLRPAEAPRRAVRAGQRLGAADLLRPPGRARRLRPRDPELPPRRMVAVRRRGGRAIRETAWA